jgi:hypothetical protein
MLAAAAAAVEVLLPMFVVLVEVLLQAASNAQHRPKNAIKKGVGRMGGISLTKAASAVEEDSGHSLSQPSPLKTPSDQKPSI